MFNIKMQFKDKQGRVINTQGFEREVQQRLRGLPARIANSVLYSVAQDVVSHNTQAILRGQTPGGQRQKQNSAWTTQHKIATGRRPIPLIYDGTLSNYRNWKVGRRRGSNVVTVDPPLDSQQNVRSLRAQGYSLVELPSQNDLFWMVEQGFYNLPPRLKKELFDFWGMK